MKNAMVVEHVQGSAWLRTEISGQVVWLEPVNSV